MNTYKIDFTTKTIIITKEFADKASNPSSAEYHILKEVQRDFSDFKILRKTHRKPAKYRTKSGEEYSCNQYKNLTYNNMEKFMKALPEGDSKAEVVKAYYFLRYMVDGVQTNPYKLVRDWFIMQFPLYRKNPLFYLNNEVKVIDITEYLTSQEEAEAIGA